ncbi:hypothetical protein [Bdellovibrio sp. KM01]|uniref:hypothetical protein n=1 Tax=Bdellovibrio sp. KM01 TaxID=2748865 RepID=UPI0015E93E2E|nr:hypothetical protein [Bdellovibrio sp. KM01]QLY26705.1 hypothetical protein HW988_06770 [Bdellovibrio sp. KM01]
MNSVKSLSVIAAISFALAACSSSKSEDKNSEAVAQAESLNGENIHCENVEVISIPETKETPAVKMKYETIIDSVRSASKDGVVEKISDKGTKVFKVYMQNKNGEYELSSSQDSTFESDEAKTVTTLENGDVKEVGTLKVSSASGSEPQLSENSYDQISRSKDGVKKIVYKLVNGVEVPVYDFETTEQEVDGVKTITTLLKTPYIQESNGVKSSIESSQSTCTISKK